MNSDKKAGLGFAIWISIIILSFEIIDTPVSGFLTFLWLFGSILFSYILVIIIDRVIQLAKTKRATNGSTTMYKKESLNPYDNTKIADLIWETELVSNKHTDGGIVLIRTKEGWRAFLGTMSDEYLSDLENTLENNMPWYDDKRSMSIVKAIQYLLSACLMNLSDYIPMQYTDSLKNIYE